MFQDEGSDYLSEVLVFTNCDNILLILILIVTVFILNEILTKNGSFSLSFFCFYLGNNLLHSFNN